MKEWWPRLHLHKLHAGISPGPLPQSSGLNACTLADPSCDAVLACLLLEYSCGPFESLNITGDLKSEIVDDIQTLPSPATRWLSMGSFLPGEPGKTFPVSVLYSVSCACFTS